MKFLLIILTLMASLGASQMALAAKSNLCAEDEICYDNNDSTALVSTEQEQLMERDDTIMPQGLDIAESYSSLPTHIAAQGERVFIFSPRLLRWAAYDAQGYQVASGKANGGASYCPELGKPCLTPRGAFRVQRKGTIDCVSSRFPLGTGGAPMPYCMHFGGGFAIHGSPYISNRNTSHGCIRVHTAAAKWLHSYFMQRGTKVIVLPY